MSEVTQMAVRRSLAGIWLLLFFLFVHVPFFTDAGPTTVPLPWL